MSEFFVQNFNKLYKCSNCKKSKLVIGSKTFSLCQEHLKIARDKWRNWASERRSDGLCCYCDLKSFNGWLRCRKHTVYNRKNCLKWDTENRGYKCMYALAKRQDKWAKEFE